MPLVPFVRHATGCSADWHVQQDLAFLFDELGKSRDTAVAAML